VRILGSALLMALAVSSPIGPAVGQPAPAAGVSAPAAAAADTDMDRVVCHTSAAPTGTRLGSHRECHSQREWDRRQQEEQNLLTKMQVQHASPGSGGG
jgi:hypothetical protein